MFNKFIYIFLLLGLTPMLTGQDCTIQVSGYVLDEESQEPLDYVNILILENQKGSSTDSTGSFRLPPLCPGDYHFVLSHLSCEAQSFFIQISKDTSITFKLDHSAHLLHSVVISGESESLTTQHVEVLTEQNINDEANENLSNLLNDLVGVSRLTNGSGIAKPVVHGLYGNRLTILNNGVSQSGQQWGNDHSPEIDPLVANKIKVIKGTSALEYLGANLGSVILVEPEKISREPHLHGKFNYFFESNGRGHGTNLQLKQYGDNFGWKINGTLKKSGDKSAANYYLTNTGIEEANLALQVEKAWTENFHSNFYASSFNSKLGVLRGSHIGNLTNLEQALIQDVPFKTKDHFSYALEAPHQKVNHHLIKFHSKYFLKDSEYLDWTVAMQINNRKEFDIRRAGRTEVPALNLLQYSYFVEAKYHKEYSGELHLNSGAQFNMTDNTNDPDTGISPLIPDYLSYETGLYTTLSKRNDRSLFELGLRYDYVLQNVVTTTQTVPKEIVRFSNQFHNISSTAGWNLTINDEMAWFTNLGYATRNPAINELHSQGLHQGVSGIEEGNELLQSEKSLKLSTGINGHPFHSLFVESLFYIQGFKDYIFLEPQDEIRLTVRGAFPVFSYQQTDARIIGFDGLLKYEFSPLWHSELSYSFIKARDTRSDLSLINLPSNNLKASINYAFSKAINIGKRKFENVELEMNNQYVFKQNDLLATQDYVEAPDAYNLLGLKLSGEIQLNKSRLRIVTRVNNLLNVSYRDYLNRQRYFADDLGINVIVGLSLKF